jgi:hypothetical protein
MTPWCPFAEPVQAPRDGGSFVAGPFRGVLHTTESMRYTPSTQSYYGHGNWPHATAWIDADGKPRLAQHIPLDRAARAMENDAGGAQTNRHSAVQLEIAWTAQQADLMPRALLDLVARFMRWVEAETGTKRTGPEFWPYPRSYGATTLRFTAAEWARFNGWCGHQHVPENAHGDPGDIGIAYLLGGHEEDEDMPLSDADKAWIKKLVQETVNGAFEARERAGGIFARIAKAVKA